MSAQPQVITISAKGRAQTCEILRAQVVLIRAIIASFRRSLLDNLPLWLQVARAGFGRGYLTDAVYDYGRTKELQEVLAGSLIAGKLQMGRTAKAAGMVAPVKFAEIFPADTPPTKAIEWLRQLPVTTRQAWEAALARYRQPAFFISGVEQKEVLLMIRAAIEESLQKGLTLKQYEDLIRSKISDLALTSGRLRNVWHQNVTQAFIRGRDEEMQDPAVKAVLPYYLFDAIVDGVVRPNHKALENGIAPVDWPLWERYKPMLGFNCRCARIAITAARAKRLLESGQAWDMTQGVPAGAGPDENYVRMAA